MLKPELINRLEEFLTKENMKGPPATAEQIAEAELLMNTKFPADYVDFITRFGGAYAGIAIHAFQNSSIIGKETVTELTQSMRKSLEKDDPRRPEVLQSIAFADDGSGNWIALNADGEVVIIFHDSDELETLASDLGEFIEENFLEW